jgi:hypothetical protein
MNPDLRTDDMRTGWIDENYTGEPVFETAVSALGAAWLFDPRIPPPVLPAPPPVRRRRKRTKGPGGQASAAGTYEGS